MSCQTQPLAAAAFSDTEKRVSLHRSVRFSSESRSSARTPNDDKRETTSAISLTSLVQSPAACDNAMSQSAPPNTSFDVDDAPPPPASCRFPKLEECAHFHYSRVSLGGVSITLRPSGQPGDKEEGWVCLEVRSHVNSPADTSTSLGGNGGGNGGNTGGLDSGTSPSDGSWTLSRNAENFLRLDDLLHRCIYDRKVSNLPKLSEKLTPELIADRWRYRQLLAAYVHHLSMIADDSLNCGPVLNWLQMDNKGHKLLVSREDSSSINTPAVAAAYSVRKYTSQARDEISFDVGDMISVIDMPGPSESVWWRGKRGFRVGFFPHACVAVIGDKVPRHMSQPPPIVHSVAVAPMKPVLRKHGKLISLFRSFILSRPPRRALRSQGILKERVFGCDLGELLLNCGGHVPAVLAQCARAIEERGAVDGIYRLSGGAGLTQKLRAAFDAGEVPDLGPALLARDPHAVASLLKMYFRELPNPLCTYQLYEPLVEAVAGTGASNGMQSGVQSGVQSSVQSGVQSGVQNGEGSGVQSGEESLALKLRTVRNVLVKLPPPHYRTLAYLARHLLRVSRLHALTGMTARNMAIVWAPNLLRCPRPRHALQGVAVQAVVTEFLICYAEELFAEDQAFDTDVDTDEMEQSEQVELRGMEACKRPKSLPVQPPTKLLSLEEARRRGMSTISPPPLQPSCNQTPNYIEVGSGPNNLPQYHTVIDLPLPGSKRGAKRSPGGWRRLFTRSKPPPHPLPDTRTAGGPLDTEDVNMEEDSPVRAARSCESLCEGEAVPAPTAPRPTALHARSSSCDSYFEGWQQELREMRLRLAPQETRQGMFNELGEDSTGSTPMDSAACSIEPSPRKLSDPDTEAKDRPSLEEQLATIGYIDVESPRVAPRQDAKRLCKERDSPHSSMSDFQAAVAAVKLRERSSPRKSKPSARYSGMHQPVSLTDETKHTAVNSRLSWQGRDGHSTLIKIDWPAENTSASNLTTSTLNSEAISPVTPVYDMLESDSEVSEANKQTIKVENKDCQNCDREKCLQCELKAADCDNLKIEDYTEQNIQDSLEHSPVHSTEISYQNLNRLSTSSNSEPNSDRKRDHSYENCEALKLMTSSHESSSSYSNASFTKQSDDYECCRKRPNYINLQSSSTSKSSPGSPLKSPLKSTISITFRSPTKSTSEFDNIETPTNDRDSLYEDIDLDKNLSIVEEAPVPGTDASLPTQQACQPDFTQDLIILEAPTDDNVDVYSQVKFFRRSIQEVNAMILESPEKDEKEEQNERSRNKDSNIYENVNFDDKDYEDSNVDTLGVCDKHVELEAAVDNICEAVNNKVIENSEPLANERLEKENGNVIKQKVVSTNLNVRELANRFESPTEQKPQFNFDKTKIEPKSNQEQKDEEKKCVEIISKDQNAKPNTPQTYKLDKTSTNARSLDENAFIKEFGNTESDRRKSLEVKDFKKRSKYLPDLNLNLEENETKIESITPTTENKISLIQRFNDMIKPEIKTLIDTDTEKKLSRERIEKYKEERRNFLREKYSSQSFRSNPEQLTRIKLKKDSSETIDIDAKEELQKFERRNTVDSGQRLRFSLARSANNLDAIQSPLSPKQDCFPMNVGGAGVAQEFNRKDKASSFHIRDMAAMFEQKSLNSP